MTWAQAPSAAGWIGAASAQVVLSADDPTVTNEGRSGVLSTAYSCDAGVIWTDCITDSGVNDPVPVTSQSTTTLQYRSTEASGNVGSAKSVTLRLDSGHPATKALRGASVRRYHTVNS